jgi:hypothetical protein
MAFAHSHIPLFMIDGDIVYVFEEEGISSSILNFAMTPLLSKH